MMDPQRGMPSVFADADALFDDDHFNNELSAEEEARILTAMLSVCISTSIIRAISFALSRLC